ncbi:MAG TPA: peptide deformylase [Gemmatimonadaceae bacterium]|jgi:peptide deformylase|nr:peptide deformylase [Gemmatimonadaceae bacterium]
MALLPIRVLGDPILREETVPVTEFGDELQRLIDDMFETMRAAQGIGLAAPQVGRRERLTVIDVEGAEYVLINPEVVERSGTDKAEEGCLSIPDVYGDVERATRVVVRALDRHGKPFEVDAEALLARCMQHEIDHLFGTLFLDHLSLLKRRRALAKWAREKEKYPDFIRHLLPSGAAAPGGHDEEL